MGKKIIDFKMRGRKSKAGGYEKSKATQLYTPLIHFEGRSGKKAKQGNKSRAVGQGQYHKNVYDHFINVADRWMNRRTDGWTDPFD